MSLRVSTTRTIGLAVALTLGAASVSAAQTDTTRARGDTTMRDTTRAGARSTQRIPVTKDAPAPTTSGIPVQKEPTAARPDTTTRVSTGEVTTPRDTAMVRTDTAVVRTDTAMVRTDTAVAPPPVTPTPTPEPTPEPAPTTTQVQTDMMRTGYMFGASGFYIGIGGGATVPYNQYSRLGYRTGYNISVPLGWRPIGSPFGVQLSLGYNTTHAEETRNPNALPAFQGSAPDPKTYSATLDATLAFPLGAGAREGRGLELYLVGGGGAYMFRGFGGVTALADVLGDDVAEGDSEPVEKNVTKWGLNAGAGLSWGLGPAALFLESRYVNVFTSGSRTGNDYLRWIPVTIGVTFR